MTIDRRGFLGYAALGSALALAKPFSAMAQSTSNPELEEITIGELQDAMSGGRWTSRAIAERYLGR